MKSRKKFRDILKIYLKSIGKVHYDCTLFRLILYFEAVRIYIAIEILVSVS